MRGDYANFDRTYLYLGGDRTGNQKTAYSTTTKKSLNSAFWNFGSVCFDWSRNTFPFPRSMNEYVPFLLGSRSFQSPPCPC